VKGEIHISSNGKEIYTDFIVNGEVVKSAWFTPSDLLDMMH